MLGMLSEQMLPQRKRCGLTCHQHTKMALWQCLRQETQGAGASRRWKLKLRRPMRSWIADWHTRTAKRKRPPQTANINAKTTSCLRFMQASTLWTSTVSYDHLFASEQAPSLHLKIDNEGALGNIPSTPTKKTSTNLVFARTMPTKRGRWGRERERERERGREREKWEQRRG